MRTYRYGFILALVGNIVLVGTLVGFWWHSRPPKPAANEQPKQGASRHKQPRIPQLPHPQKHLWCPYNFLRRNYKASE